ncbi:MAG: SLBB domain-containing protein [Candidatus Firestonebacteria bacterium]|nr:SLBB domain-containing protein [Candidatus Firestonebacteria bacterium]
MKNRFISYLLIISLTFSLLPAATYATNEEKNPGEKIIGQEYKLQPDDVIRISVWGYPELEKAVQILPEGIISFPPIEEKINVSGLSVPQLENLLLTRLLKYLKDVKNVQVIVQEYRGARIFIMGQVLSPGQYSFSIMPDVLGLMTRAGGAAVGASLRAIRIIRGDKEKPEVILVDFEKFLQTGDVSLLPKLKAGDTVYVPRLGEEGKLIEEIKREEINYKTISIIGEVRATGIFPLETPIELMDAISRAGGPTPYALLNKIKIISHENGLPVIKIVDLNSYMTNGNLAGNPLVKAGDTIIIPKYFYEGLIRSEVEPEGNVVYVLGEIYKPGTYQLGTDRNIWNIIQLSGGTTNDAYLNKIKVIKGVGNKDYPKTLKLDLTENINRSDFTTLPALESGDTVIVPKKSYFWRETVKFFSEVAIIVGVVNLFNK